MKQKWGRKEYAGDWPSGKAVWTIGAFFVALTAAGAISAYRYARVWTPLQKHYLTAYLGTEGAGAIRKDGWYTLLMAETRKGPAHLALDAEVTPVTTASGENTFALTDEAVEAGDAKLAWERGRYDNAKLHQALAHWIYNDQSPTDLLRPALWGGLGVFLVGLIVAIFGGCLGIARYVTAQRRLAVRFDLALRVFALAREYAGRVCLRELGLSGVVIRFTDSLDAIITFDRAFIHVVGQPEHKLGNLRERNSLRQRALGSSVFKVAHPASLR